MAATTIDDIWQEYRAALLGKRTDANVDQEDSDYWIRGHVTAGVAAGVRADIERDALDAFPQSARREALLRAKFAYFNNSAFDPATVASGPAQVTGTNGTLLPAGTQATHLPSGNTYATTADVTISSGTATPTWQSITAGQSQNLAIGAILTISSPPAGINSTATVLTPGIADGTNEEDESRLATRLLNRMQSSARGGNDADHIAWAFEVTGVTGAAVVRYPNGFGSVAVIITSGTTDIDTALDNGDPITFTPSSDLITAVQDHIESVDPATEGVFVYGPSLPTIDVTVAVKFLTGDKDTVLSGQTLTQGQLVAREVKRAIYKTITGGVKINGTGYVTKKSIEDMIDSRLSAGDTVLGSTLQIVTDRIVSNLDGGNANKSVATDSRAIPGTITVTNE